MKKFIYIIFLLIFFVNTAPAYAQPVNLIDVTYNGVTTPNPVFNVANMLPGDTEEEIINIKNVTTGDDFEITLKGNKTAEEKDFSQVLEIEIIDENSVTYYGGSLGVKPLSQFLAESSPISLGNLTAGADKDYKIIIKFPFDAGNKYQNASVTFNLTVDPSITFRSLVINEVYYNVDGIHGLDSPKDRGITDINGNNITAVIEGNGAGSTNTINISAMELCKIVQQNGGNINNAISIYSNSGGNSAGGNTQGSVNVVSGSSNVFVNVYNYLNYNFGSCNAKKLKLNNEWIEIYNPSQESVILKKWKLKDNSGEAVAINTNTRIDPGKFVLISRDSSTWNYWNENIFTKKVNLGRSIGDGLDNTGDHIYLIDPEGNNVDFVSWGNDTEIWNPAVNGVAEGHSIERVTAGFDNDIISDWFDNNFPTPGN